MADSKKSADRIYWESNEVDEEAALPASSSTTPQDKGITIVAPDVPASAIRPGLRRERSNGSLSIRPLSRRNSIDATAALPIQYRTLSIDVDEYAQKRLPLKKDKKTVADLAHLHWHTIPADEVAMQLSTSPKTGLSSDQVVRRHTQYGKNLPSAPPSHFMSRVLGYFFKGFGPVLLVASILVFIAWKPLGKPPAIANLALAIVLAAIFFIQALFNMWQDWSSARVMSSIQTMLPDDCLVLRDGHMTSVPAPLIVPGDVLMIKAGNKLPADVRFIETSSSGGGGGDTKFDRSILTGESLPLPATVDSTDDNYLETRCIGLQGTHCVSGTCTAIVVATGDNTVFGRIAKLTNEPKTGMSTLEREIFNFVAIVCIIMFLVIVLVLIVWGAWLRHSYPDWISVPNLIISIVSVAVAFVPEGLPVALAASMTISANMMRKNNILCKSLKTVETLGSVSIICSDKTGTLTQNKMIVTECAVGGKRTMTTDEARDALLFRRNDSNNANDAETETDVAESVVDIDGAGIGRPSRHPLPHEGASALDQLRAVAALCNDGQFDVATRHLPLADQTIHGDATDQAVLRFSETLGAAGSVAALRGAWSNKFTLPFNSKNKYMIRALSLAHNKDGLSMALPAGIAAVFQPNDLLLTIKGAPEILLERIQFYVNPANGVAITMDAETRAQIATIKDTWSAKGRRVILLARKTLSASSLPQGLSSSTFEEEMQRQAKTGMTLVGLVGIVDPPRPEIPEVVQTLRRAGIRIFMVTGDFALTAQAIAAECGIITANPATGTKVDTIADLPRGGAPPIDVDDDHITAKTAFGKQRFVPVDARKAIVLSGPELLGLNESQWDTLAQYEEIVFARTTPEQKLRIVRELRGRSYIVGMTGDGVNDAPSLRAADIGIAMGSGSDMAREAADMVLLDNSFSSVVEALRFGRMMFDNLKKTIAYLLPAGTFSEFWPVITNVVFGIPQILSSFLMIIICLFTDPMASIALAYEAPEADVLTRPPRLPGKDRLVDWKLLLQAYGITGTIETFCSFSMAYWYLERSGIPFFSAIWFRFGNLPDGIDPDYYAEKLNVASSIYFVNLVVMQWFNLLAMRTRRLSIFQHPPVFNKRTQNLSLFAAIGFAVVMVIFWLYVPKFQTDLDNMPVPAEHWFLPMAFGMGILLLDEGRKYCVRGWPKGILAKIAW
ncbi:h k atpase alpha [Ophiostoma piceae UAMH 11346]|uniref:H k atpase alpha n=1 Tax=Ophiostoma piceae (strain UAMH 11346) TaxID=1262450 RepID=S3CMZ4_OPHP1|nr:h k atpase alpha [Ophiostoma piceae UAMH 11346]